VTVVVPHGDVVLHDLHPGGAQARDHL
jgi:hypothetical protein